LRPQRPFYFAAFTTAIPQGPSPTLIRRSSLRDFTSTTETSFDAPFAVYSFEPLGSSAIPQARLPTGIIATIDSSPSPSPRAERRGDRCASAFCVSITATAFPRPVETYSSLPSCETAVPIGREPVGN